MVMYSPEDFEYLREGPCYHCPHCHELLEFEKLVHHIKAQPQEIRNEIVPEKVKRLHALLG